MRRAVMAAAVMAVLVLAGWLVVVMIAAGLPQPGDLATRVPERTQLMMDREREAAGKGRHFRVERHWVPYSGISPTLRRAVLIAEDDAFFSHDGLDWDEIKDSARANLRSGHVVRGGSTITQQLAKNLWLGERRTLTRKLAEMILALRLERALTKRRIFELYLNEIEWGDGVFGVDAAARHWFGTPAGSLTPKQSAALAAVIINPRRYSPVRPDRRIGRRMRMILSRMHRRGFLDDAAYAEAIGRPLPAAADSSDATPGAAPGESLSRPGLP